MEKTSTITATAVKEVRVTCEGAALAAFEDLLPFQDGLKTLAPASYEKLRASLVKHGFNFPFFVWKRGAKLFTLDGHQRLEALGRMRAEGFRLPPLPIAFIQAAGEKEAREKILLISSQYGKMTDESLRAFIESSQLDVAELAALVDFPQINFAAIARSLVPPAVEPPLPALRGGVQIINAESIAGLRQLPAESIQCAVTSPPYWGLRDYGTAAWVGGREDCDHKEKNARGDGGRSHVDGFHGSTAASSSKGAMQFRGRCPMCGAIRVDDQLGNEKTPEEYVSKLVVIFRELKRVLRKDGTVWLNLGDSYAGGGPHHGDKSLGKSGSNRGSAGGVDRVDVPGLKAKDLVGIPWRVAFALQADGWFLRCDIIWSKLNPMPESVEDRPTKEHEYIFLLSKSDRYFFDAEAVREAGSMHPVDWNEDGTQRRESKKRAEFSGKNTEAGKEAFRAITSTRNIRSVWEMVAQPYPGSHFATFPEELPRRCILAGTSAAGCCARCGAPVERVKEKVGEKRRRWSPNDSATTTDNWRTDNGRDTQAIRETVGWRAGCACAKAAPVPCSVLDPFAGSGTTGAVALELGRRAVLIELSAAYISLIRRRCGVPAAAGARRARK